MQLAKKLRRRNRSCSWIFQRKWTKGSKRQIWQNKQ